MTGVGGATVTGTGQAYPASERQEVLWQEFFSRHFGGGRLAGRIFGGAGVRTRHCVANPLLEDLSEWSTGDRMARYTKEATPLGKDAVATALDRAGLGAERVGMFAVVSCTGYVTPGLDIGLARDLGMPPDVQRLVIGHMGCYAAVPGLASVTDYVVARGRPAVLLCIELTSLHIQPPTRDLQQVIAHALFSDAAAAVVVEPASRKDGRPGQATTTARPGLRVVDIAAVTDAATADYLTWDVTDLGFRMGLSPRVPDVLARHVKPMLSDLLGRNRVGLAEVAGWAIHPGGPRILETVERELGLPGTALAASRAVLAEHGNCSSATILLVLEELRANHDLVGGDYIVAAAFGPGLTLYAVLLQVC